MRYEVQVVRALLPLLSGRRAAVPVIAGLGLLSSAFEGIGLYLFLPLLAVIGGEGAEDPGMPRVFSEVLRLLPEGSELPVLVALVVASVALKNAVAYLNGVYFAAVDAETSHRLRSRLFAAILAASPGFLDRQEGGRVPNTLMSETWRVARALNAMFMIVTEAAAVVILAAVLTFISWQATLLVAPFLLAIVAVLHLVTGRAKALGQAAVVANTEYTRRAWEGISFYRTIRLFARGDFEQERMDRASRSIRQHFLALAKLSTATPVLFEVMVAASVGVWIVALAWSGVGVPTMAVFLVVLYRMQPRVRNLVVARASLLENGGAVLAVESLLDECRASVIPSGDRPVEGIREAVTLDRVGVTYPGTERPALADVTIRIPRDRTTAIVGPSGSGKSTIVSLLGRLMDPDKGAVRVDGTDLRDLRLDDWSKVVGVVAQDIQLFNATVAENIAYGRPDATKDDIVEAARLADAHGFIAALPQGYDTEVGDRGVRLSGGQRQRIALARALVRRPKLLVLDEATNALDSRSEDAIRATIEQLGGSMTIVMVAHRLSTVRGADRIVVLDWGRVVEQGGYDELVARDGLFAAMVRLQTLDSAIRSGAGGD